MASTLLKDTCIPGPGANRKDNLSYGKIIKKTPNPLKPCWFALIVFSHLFLVYLDCKLLRGALAAYYFVKNSIALLLLLELEAGSGKASVTITLVFFLNMFLMLLTVCALPKCCP